MQSFVDYLCSSMALDTQMSYIFVFFWPALVSTLMARNLQSFGPHLGAYCSSYQEKGNLTIRVVP